MNENADVITLETHQGPGGARIEVYASGAQASLAVAHQMASLIREKSQFGERTVLGLATGSTPQDIYDELVRLHREEGLSFAGVVTFNLDEYWPMAPDSLQSYRRFMSEYLFDQVDIDPRNIHVPDGTLSLEDVPTFCRRYEEQIREAGGIDYQILGIGRTGHIGFNEPGSPLDSRTRLITLDRVTRMDAAGDFFGEWNVPRKAITMGVGTILDARKVVLLAFGEHKSGIIRQAVEDDVTSTVSASSLQRHPGATFVLDPAAAAELTRFKTPWLTGAVESLGLSWDASLTRRAVIWLARCVDKPILKLTEEDYNEHGLQDLLSARGSAYDLNIAVFKALQRTITGWPGGKRGRPRLDGSDDTFPKRVVVFSPHPDDDVVSMGGTFIRLCEQGHEVHVAYQTSGNIAVWDDEALRHMDFVLAFCEAFHFGEGTEKSKRIAEQVRAFIESKRAGDVDIVDLQRIKTLIRRTEARSAARYSGVTPAYTHFLDMPFYETGRVRKKPLGIDDIEVIKRLLLEVRPAQIYAAGDLSDPHGTHRICLAAIRRSLGELLDSDWMPSCEILLYRGAWQEWEPDEIDMAVPLSPDEVERKRMAIFKHPSQKDKALFPGPWDTREFWQRAEARNRETAQIYDRLGLPEYQALEGFVRIPAEAFAREKGAYPLYSRRAR